MLSWRGYSVNQIADIFSGNRETVTAWLSRWEEAESDGFEDESRAGRPSLLNEEEEKQVFEIVKQELRSLQTLRDESEFEKANQELDALKKAYRAGFLAFLLSRSKFD